MSDPREVRFFPKALEDLQGLEEKYVRQILADLALLRSLPWPPGKVKKLHGSELWEVKTGNYRSLFYPHGREAIVVRVVNRRDLEKAVPRFDIRYVEAWLRRQRPG